MQRWDNSEMQAYRRMKREEEKKRAEFERLREKLRQARRICRARP